MTGPLGFLSGDTALTCRWRRKGKGSPVKGQRFDLFSMCVCDLNTKPQKALVRGLGAATDGGELRSVSLAVRGIGMEGVEESLRVPAVMCMSRHFSMYHLRLGPTSTVSASNFPLSSGTRSSMYACTTSVHARSVSARPVTLRFLNSLRSLVR